MEVNLSEKTSIWVGGVCKSYFEVISEKEFVEATKYGTSRGLWIIALWMGTNIFFSRDVQEVVIKLNNKDIVDLWEWHFKIWAWVSLQWLITYLAKLWFDLSCLSWYPSSIGGGVSVNSGLKWRSLGDYLVSGRIYNLQSGLFELWGNGEFEFKYRWSRLKESRKYIFWEWEFVFSKWNDILKNIETIKQERLGKQPVWRCSGCFFKNPEWDSAWRLIDAAWFKWYAIWGAYMSEIHANFLMTLPGCKVEDVLKLVIAVKDTVKDKFGVLLEEEVVII